MKITLKDPAAIKVLLAVGQALMAAGPAPTKQARIGDRLNKWLSPKNFSISPKSGKE